MLTLYGAEFQSRLLLGTAQYPSPEILKQAVTAAGRRDRHRLTQA